VNGEYRILYEVDDQAQHVTIFLIGHRIEVVET
jgi:mRNA-degrading endonuclease RelE of RelBE toxin-antitoxin system